MFCWLFLVLGIISSCIFIYKRDANSGHIALLLKTSSSVLFIITAVVAIYYNRGDVRYGLMTVLGLVFSMLGDIWLDLKWIYPKDIRYFLYGGFAFFILGHVCYISAMSLANGFKITDILLCMVAPVVVSLGTQFAAKPLELDFTGYKFIASLYSFFLTMTVSTAVTAVRLSKGSYSQIMMLAGAVLFFISDLILSNTYFGKNKTSRSYIIANHSFYYAGQFMIAMSVFFFE